MGKEITPIDADKKIKWDNKSDESSRLIEMSISNYLRFHFQRIDTPYASWEKFETIFGKHNEVRGH